MVPRRLALVHYTAPPVTGGVESILGTHARLLKAEGHDVRVIAGQGEAVIIPQAWSRHPEVERVTRALASPNSGIEPAFAQIRDRLSEQLQPLLADRDLVIVHNVLTMPLNLPLAHALAAIDRPKLAWTHDLGWINPRYRDYQRPEPLLDILHQPQPNTTYVAISQTRQREIADTFSLPAGAVPIVPNGINMLDFCQISQPVRELAQEAGFATARPLVLAPVRVTRRKQLELALQAVAILRDRHPQVQMVVTGPLGPHSADNLAYAAELRQLRQDLRLESSVRFLFELTAPDGRHPVDDQAIAQLYRMADCVLLPSESEGFGLPALEAALARAPLIAADIDVIREVAGPDAYLFPAGASPAQVAQTLEEALSAPPAHFRRQALDKHDWGQVLPQLKAVIAGAASGRG